MLQISKNELYNSPIEKKYCSVYDTLSERRYKVTLQIVIVIYNTYVSIVIAKKKKIQ